MIDLVTYKWLHLVGAFFILISFGALVFRSSSGANSNEFSKRKLSVIHGLGMIMSLIGGFGMLARLGIGQNDWPSWVSIKFGIWLVLGFLIAAVNRVSSRSVAWFWLILLMTMSAAYLGLNHPLMGAAQ